MATFKHGDNARATRLEDINTFFWKMRVYRLISLAALDGLLGWLLYLSSTNRAFITPPSIASRIETSTRILDVARSKMSAMAILKNTISRNENLREKVNGYWVHEGRLMGEIMEEREVLEGVQNALENRIDMATIQGDAEAYARNVMGPFEGGGDVQI